VSLFLVLVGLIGPVIPKWGFYMWIGGWAVCLALFITSIVMVVKGAPARGVLGLLFSVAVLPLWIIVAPVGVLVIKEGRGWEQAFQEVMQQQGITQSEVIGPSSDPAGSSTGVNPAPVAAAPAPAAGESETITAKDGRTIRGTIDAYHTWGVRVKRDDGLVVNVTFELMSDGDAQKFRDRSANRAR
jgi:hypothetical protein